MKQESQVRTTATFRRGESVAVAAELIEAAGIADGEELVVIVSPATIEPGRRYSPREYAERFAARSARDER